MMFDLNDFDETLPGPFEYDVKRMAASFTIAPGNNAFTKADAASRNAGVGECLPRDNRCLRRAEHTGHLVRTPVRRRADAGDQAGDP